MDGTIRRDPRAAQDESYDLVVVGGGIHGAAAALAAAGAGRRILLLEREDFGAATSWNSLRILHGGLRYLQSLDLRRFRRSVRARAWYVEEFPELVEPLACLMPLYGRGLRRRATLGPALRLNELLRDMWATPAELEMFPPGELLSTGQVVERFGAVRRTGLTGGALWYDGLLPRPQRVLIEMLRRTAALGGEALNHMEVTSWTVSGGRVAAVRARDSREWSEYEFRTDAVLNCAGPWAPALAARHDPALLKEFHPSTAFNLLLDHPLDSAVSVAVEPAGGGRTYFLHPLEDCTLAGTYHLASADGDGTPTPEAVEAFLADLRAAVPDFHVTPDHVLRVMWGVVPARERGSTKASSRPLLRAAADADGPDGLHSLVGIKYTTAPLAAAEAVARVFPTSAGSSTLPGGTAGGVPVRDVPDWTGFGLLADRDPEAAGALLDVIVQEESVLEPDDLLLRRTDWGLDPRDRKRAYARVRQLRPGLFERSA
ncbi:MAG: FAD-dependent oxidoreductase [Gemmatimonadota bacterium]